MNNSLSRRDILQAMGAMTAIPMVGGAVAQQGRTIRIGFVSPQSGPLAAMGEADKWTIESLKALLTKGVTAGGKRYSVDVLLKDSQSNPNRAGEMARDLILNDKVDLMLVSSTPETTNPVSDACELNAVPHISTMAPWQPWFFGRGGNPDKGFQWGYHFFWGIEDLVAVQMNMWKALESNKRVGGLFPNDSDGNAAGDPDKGFKPMLSSSGFTLVDPGRYQNMTQTFATHISEFRRDGVELITGIVLPPDLKTFLAQARQQGLKLKAVSVGKAAMYPTNVEALGSLGEGVSCEVWWRSHGAGGALVDRRTATDQG